MATREDAVDNAEQARSHLLDKEARERVDRFCEWGILGLVLAIIGYGTLALGAVRMSEFLVLQFLTVGVLALWAVRYWFGKTHRLLWTPPCWAVAAFVVYAVFRYATAEIEYVARQEFIRVLIYSGLFFAILTNLHRQEPTRIIALGLVGLGTFISLYAVYQWLTNSEHVWHFLKPRCYFKRASGSYICPDHCAGFLAMLLPLALSYTLTGRFKTVPRVLLGYASLMMLLGIGVTISHGAWLASAIGLLVFFAFIMRQRSYRLIGTVSILVILCGAGLFYIKLLRARERLATTEAPVYERVPWQGIWPAAWRMWQDNLWFGAGPGHFDYRYRQYRLASPTTQNRPGRVHNDYLNTLADWGVAGLALAMLVPLTLFGGAFWGWRYIRRSASDLKQKKSNKSAFVLGASIGIFTLMILSVYDFNLHIPANAILVVTLMALVAGHARFATDQYWVTQRLAGQVLGTVVIGVVGIYLLGTGVGMSREQWWLGKAARQKEDAPAQLAALRKAWAAQSRNFETSDAIGDLYRLSSGQKGEGWQEQATTAVDWYLRSLALDPYDSYAWMRIGMCEHWLGHAEKAEEAFQKAIRLDPNSYFMRAHLGWYYVQLKQYEKARDEFRESLGLKPVNNPIVESYLPEVEARLSPPQPAPTE